MAQPSPRFITAAEVAQDEAGDVQGPDSAVDGNIALFDGTTGKLLKAAGVVEGVATIDATTNILIGDGAGNAVDSNVPIDAIGGSFMSANIARVDSSGSDETGTVGDLTKPFLTVQAALDAIVDAVVGVSVDGVIQLGASSFSEELSVEFPIEITSVAISFIGLRGHGSLDYKAFDSLTITGGAVNITTEIFLENCVLGNTNPISCSSANLFLYAHNVDFGAATINFTGAGTCQISSRSNSSGGIYQINANSASQIAVCGLWSASGDPTTITSVSPNAPVILLNQCNRVQVPENIGLSESLFNIDAPEAVITAIQSIVGDLTCTSSTFIDARVVGSVTIDTPIVYQDVFLKSVPPGGTTGQALEEASNNDFDTEWASLI